jgi:Rrf2 family protein
VLLTRASEYALLSLILISKESTPQDVETLSNKLGISKSFLAKILQLLSKNGVLNSFKGAKGGFELACKPEDISLKKIIEVVEKKPTTVFECATSEADCPSGKGSFCLIWPFLNKFQNIVDDFFNSLTLKDIL